MIFNIVPLLITIFVIKNQANILILYHTCGLKSKIKNNENDADVSRIATKYGKVLDWTKVINERILKLVVKSISDIAPISKGYDEVSALQLVLGCFHLSPEDKDEILRHTGCVIETINATEHKLMVTDNDKFWSFFNNVMAVNLDDISSVSKLKDSKVFQILLKYEHKLEKNNVTIITDPGTDPNSDDEKAAAFIEKMRDLLDLWSNSHYIISAVGSLGEREERLRNILESIGVEGWSISIYDTENERDIETKKYNRFYAPAAFSWDVLSFVVKSFEECMMNNDDIDSVLIIGQLGPKFALSLHKLCDEKGKFRYVGLQGPGFNSLETETDILRDYGREFAWSNRDGAAEVTNVQLERSMAILDGISSKASSYRIIQIIKFLITEDGNGAFQRMFIGFRYSLHFVLLLEIIQYEVLKIIMIDLFILLLAVVGCVRYY